MSGGTDIYTEWNMYMEDLLEDSEAFRMLRTLSKLDLVDKDKMYEIRNRILNNMFGAQS